MKAFEIIQTPDYILAVSDDTPPKSYEGFYYLNSKIFHTNKYCLQTGCKSIEAYLPLNDEFILEGVPLLPKIVVEDDVEKLALEVNPILMEGDWDKNKQYRDEWINGYKTATKIYNEEDMRKAVEIGLDARKNNKEIFRKRLTKEKEIEILLQPFKKPKYPKVFVAETIGGGEYLAGEVGSNEIWAEYPIENKFITNLEGKKVLVGIYKY